MSSHTGHPDVHEHGLADGCPGCTKIAKNPIGLADTALLRRIAVAAVDPDRLGRASSDNDAVASANVLTHLERTGVLCRTAGDVVAAYLRTNWRLHADIAPYQEGT